MKTTTQTECFECGHGTLVPGIVNLVGTRNDEEFAVRVHGLECSSCGFQTIDNSQSGEFTKAVSDAYRAAHGFLTGAEIKERRHDWLNMSHKTFAEYLGVGVASTKRWENGQVQDRAMDNLIRLKTDPQAARDSLKDLESQVGTEHVLSSVALNEDLNLLFSREQKFTSKPKIKMGILKFEKGSFNNEAVLAA
jgi:putative zinc finger/helix-turn-helix YgiT family protein